VSGKVQWVPGNVTRPRTLAPALKGVNLVICAVGATARSGPDGPEAVDHLGVANLTAAARVAGVDQVVLISSMGVGGGGGLIYYFLNFAGGGVLDWKAKGEAYLRQSSVPYTIIRPAGLTDDPGHLQGIRFHQGTPESATISRADVAAVAIAALENPLALGKTFSIRSDEQLAPRTWPTQFRGLRRDP
jgi:uncharacterized protein YbjT (DUF2867 family)